MMVLMPRSWRSWPQSAQLLPPTKVLDHPAGDIASAVLPAHKNLHTHTHLLAPLHRQYLHHIERVIALTHPSPYPAHDHILLDHREREVTTAGMPQRHGQIAPPKDLGKDAQVHQAPGARRRCESTRPRRFCLPLPDSCALILGQIEARCANAAWGGRPTKLSEVEDVASDKSLPGNPHYSRLDMVEPGAAPTPCTLRKKAPCPPGYTPPLRTAQQGGELELFVGLVRLQDGMPPPLAQTVNTGVVPKWRDQTLTEAGVRAGCVVRVEYTRTSGEISLSLGLKAREERGGVNDAETVVGRVFDTVLDPDWYVSAIESAPNLVLDFFAVDYPGVDQSAKCTSNCEVKNRPHVGW